MMDHIWDAFVENAISLFMPLVCSYFTLTSNYYLNASFEEATGLERTANTILVPFQYVCAGKSIRELPDGTWQISQRFDYEKGFWARTAIYVPLLPASLILGATVKAISYVDKQVAHRYRAFMSDYKSTAVHCNLEKYQNLGIVFTDTPEFYLSEGRARRPGDENHFKIEMKAFEEIIRILDENRIPWWIDCGTCLGAHRYGGAIPWDFDIDIALLLPDFHNARRALQKLDQRKYIVQDWSGRSHPDTCFKIYVRESGTMIDMYFFDIDPEKKEIHYILSLEHNIFFPEWWKIRERRYTVPVAFDVVFPLKKALFDGIEVNLPTDPVTYLQRYYGENLAPSKVYDPITGLYEKDLTHPYWQRAYAH